MRLRAVVLVASILLTIASPAALGEPQSTPAESESDLSTAASPLPPGHSPDMAALLEAKREQLRKLKAEIRAIDAKFPSFSQVQINLKVLELRLGKIRAAGRQLTWDGAPLNQLTSGTILDVDKPDQLMRKLETNRLARILAEPMLVTSIGIPCSFEVGVAKPDKIAEGLERIGFQKLGTTIKYIPHVLEDGRLRIDLAVEVSRAQHELGADPSGQRISGAGKFSVETTLELDPGRTVLVCGTRQNRGTADSGADDETELVMMVTAHIINADELAEPALDAPPKSSAPAATAN